MLKGAQGLVERTGQLRKGFLESVKPFDPTPDFEQTIAQRFIVAANLAADFGQLLGGGPSFTICFRVEPFTCAPEKTNKVTHTPLPNATEPS